MPDSVEATGPDIAFSFLVADESLAQRLAERLRRDVRTFVYSDQQKDLAGKDGVEEFTKVYAESAQFVVVLYREGYGSTRWTRLEETAIKSRIQELGPHTAFMISLDGNKPVWLPSSRLYFGLEQFGEGEAAEAILGRFRELGLHARPETFEERAKRGAVALLAAGEAETWRQSQTGVDEVREELKRLGNLLRQRSSVIPPVYEPGLDVEPGVFSVQVRIKGARVTFAWVVAFSNVLEGSELMIHEYHRVTPEGGWGRGAWKEVRQSGAEPHLATAAGGIAWRLGKGGGVYSTEALVDHFLDRLLQRHRGKTVRQRGHVDPD